MSKKTVYTIVFLVGFYVVCQAIADVAATKMVQLGSIVLPAGSMIFAFTFTLRDMLHKRLGKVWAQAAIVCAGFFNIVQAGYLAGTAQLQAPVFYAFNDAWASIFAIVPAITLGSIIAELASELVDTEIYHLWANKFAHFPQWTRVIVSNAVSLPLDSFLFGLFAFVLLPPLFGAEATPFMLAMQLVVGQIVWKAIVTVISIPGIYMVKQSSPLVFSVPVEE